MSDTTVELAFEYGIKITHMGKFISFGMMGLPEECMEDANLPETLEGMQEAAKEMILENLIITIKPIGDDDEHSILQ